MNEKTYRKLWDIYSIEYSYVKYYKYNKIHLDKLNHNHITLLNDEWRHLVSYIDFSAKLLDYKREIHVINYVKLYYKAYPKKVYKCFKLQEFIKNIEAGL